MNDVGTAKHRRLSAVVLAAGLSRRMGNTNKLLLAVDDVPLVRRTVSQIVAAAFDEIVVVVGHEQELVTEALAGLPVRVAQNEHYRDGQVSSVRCGLQALRRPNAGVMVCPADQPLLTTTLVNTLAELFFARERGTTLVPYYQGRRGNPIVLDQGAVADILSGNSDFGCRQFVDRNPDLVDRVDIENRALVDDIDSPEDYRRCS